MCCSKLVKKHFVNAYLKRCVKKGLVKVSGAPARRYAYYLTPQGFAEKSRLTVEYLSSSFSFFRQAREDCSAVLLIQNHKVRQNTGEESIRQTLTIADVAQVVAVEFNETWALAALGVSTPPPRPLAGSQSGYFARPMG